MGKSGYSETICLPKTGFGMRANLPVVEPGAVKRWEEEGLYDALSDESRGEPFVLHDGPPYANGPVHLGRAENKVLKDLLNRYEALAGRSIRYLPGWDCHGMPIENVVLSREGVSRLRPDPNTPEGSAAFTRVRSACRRFAAKWVDVQREEFKRLGVLGEWDEPYLTMDWRYERAELRELARLVAGGYVKSGRMPIHWCPECRTALALAEIQHEETTSASLWFLARVASDPENALGGCKRALVWTTTPWTLFANRAFAFAEGAEYAVMDGKWGEVLLVAERASALSEMLGSKGVVRTVPCTRLTKLTFLHPLFDGVRVPAVTDADVSRTEGSGIVHIAPGHGREDFVIGRRYGLPSPSPVDEGGRFTAEADDVEGALGVASLSVEEGGRRAVERLTASGLLVAAEEIDHSYPHCWRCHSELLFRVTEQWFIPMNANGLRERALAEIKGVRWHPANAESRITAAVAERPDWCISRQRFWGVPIPAVRCACGERLLDERVATALADAVEDERGSDVWFSEPLERFLPDGLACPSCGGASFTKGYDILDVWLDAGLSHRITSELFGIPLPVSAVLEGPDQHRGWFNAALVASVALGTGVPYSTCITHGWTLDESGEEMHTSRGNALSPALVVDEFGADILRLWVASGDYTADVRIGKEILERLVEAYRKIRNTYRFSLGNLHDFDPTSDEPESLLPVDRYVLARCAELTDEMRAAYEAFEFHRAFHLYYTFITAELSSFYMDAAKDRLYTWGRGSRGRRSAQAALYHVTRALLVAFCPVMPFTCEEAWERLPGERERFAQLARWPTFPERLRGDERLMEDFRALLGLRDEVNKALEEARVKRSVIRSSTEARVVVTPADDAERALLERYAPHLPELFIVSAVSVAGGKGGARVSVERAPGEKCPRCWLYSESVKGGEVCPKCREAMS